ncbi:MAG: hypothetical protein NC314_02020 [Roseburia sp.]|nr:hypothetical protein [Roseburia sp.]MCM1241592.1 hypothetical protein [Roseburia sp.]
MDIKEKDEGYQFVIQEFGEEKISSRYDCLYELLAIYLERKQLNERVCIVPAILDHVIVDYFVDIYRLKDFQGMALVNDTKIMAYTSFWLLRHKPLQILDTEHADDLVFVNEDAVGEILKAQLLNNPADTVILEEKEERIDDFVNTMKYFFQYRLYTAQNIELMILAFDAGRDYQYCVDFQK